MAGTKFIDDEEHQLKQKNLLPKLLVESNAVVLNVILVESSSEGLETLDEVHPYFSDEVLVDVLVPHDAEAVSVSLGEVALVVRENALGED